MTAPIVASPGWQTVGDLRFDADFTVAGDGIRPAGQLWERLATIGAESDSERSVVALPLYTPRIAEAFQMVSTSSRFIPSASRAVQIRRGIIVAPNRNPRA